MQSIIKDISKLFDKEVDNQLNKLRDFCIQKGCIPSLIVGQFHEPQLYPVFGKNGKINCIVENEYYLVAIIRNENV